MLNLKYFGLIVLISCWVATFEAHSHGGTEHSANKERDQEKVLPQIATIPGNLSLLQRVFISKAEQFNNNLVTFLAQQSDRPQYEILPAKVIASPQGYAQVHLPQASRIIVDPAYPMPNTGDKVEANQVIAVVEPLVTSIDLTDKKTELYKIEAEITRLEKAINRLIALGNYAPHVKLEEAKTELIAAQKQKQQILSTGLGRELIRSPISGTVSDIHILPGQILQPGQPLAEIIDTSVLRVEAYTYNYALSSQILSASLRIPEDSEHLYPLTLMGLSPRVGENDQAQHILFSLKEPVQGLMIGMLVDVMVAIPSPSKKIIIPQKALLKSGTHYTVFVLSEPELIIARLVQVGVFFDERVEILEGLKPGERLIEDVGVLSRIFDLQSRR